MRLAALFAAAALFAPPLLAQEIECQNGLATLPDVAPFPCSGIDLIGYLSPAAFGVGSSPSADEHNDIWGWTDPETGTEYALVGTLNGVGFVDLSVPTSPRVVGKLPTATFGSIWRDIKVYQNHAFIVADNAGTHGMQVFDLTRLRTATSAPVLFTADARYTEIGSAHNIVINEDTGFAYIVGARNQSGTLPAACSAPGFHVVDVSAPTRPAFVTCFSDAAQETDPYIAAGYTHDAQCVVYDGPDTAYAGRELCFGANEDVVTVFDVSDKASVAVLSQGSYPNDVYTHQGWLTEDQRYFLINDEIDERAGVTPSQRTIVMDVSDLDSPEVAFIYESGLTTIDHNLYVRGRYAYEANYESGLRILDLADIGEGSMSEVAFFDTHPSGNTLNYNGAWSVYPYFESGLLLVNDINLGLFVLRPQAGTVVGTEAGAQSASGYALSEPRPNPAAGAARVTLDVERAQSVTADLYDLAGRRLATVYRGTVSAGSPLELDVPRGDRPAGVYLLRVTGEHFEASRRLVFTR